MQQTGVNRGGDIGDLELDMGHHEEYLLPLPRIIIMKPDTAHPHWQEYGWGSTPSLRTPQGHPLAQTLTPGQTLSCERGLGRRGPLAFVQAQGLWWAQAVCPCWAVWTADWALYSGLGLVMSSSAGQILNFRYYSSVFCNTCCWQ